MSKTSRTYVLIHGAWHGGWVWKGVADALRAEGHRVSALTLTGLGEREHLLTPEVGLDTHTDDVVNHIKMEKLTDVVAVGWSYGGMVLTGVLSRVPDSIASAVYLDAFVPEDGKSLADYVAREQQVNFDEAQGRGELTIRLPDTAYQDRWGITEERVLASAIPRLSPQPIKTMTDPVSAPLGLPDSINYTYIKLGGDQRVPFMPFFEKAIANSSFDTEILEDGHMIMLTAPETLFQLLLNVR